MLTLRNRTVTLVAEEHRPAAARDALTGLASRKAFIARLTERLSTPGAGEAAILLADLNGFKEINDTLSAAAAGHLYARLGGDELAVLVVAENPQAEAWTVAERLQSRRRPAGAGLAMSCSIGISVVESGDTPADVLRRANLAMYSAKRNTESRVAVFVPSMVEGSERRNLLTAELEGAVERAEMALLYQPAYRLHDRELACAEVLFRWTHPLFGSVLPEEFVPLAEDARRITSIGRWVPESGLARVAARQDQGWYLPRLHVNAGVPSLPAIPRPRTGAEEPLRLADRDGWPQELRANKGVIGRRRDRYV